MAIEDLSESIVAPTMPRVSIGMPVYNGEIHIREALDSLLAQSYTNFELIISDNASTDRTGIICQEYASRDERIRYFRQTKNYGAKANFEFVLKEARGEYFMWAAADDSREHNFLLACVKTLDQNPVCIAASSPDHFKNQTRIRDFEVRGDLFCRIRAFLTHAWESNGMFYSLMRAKQAKTFDFTLFEGLGADWIFIVHLLKHGELCRTKSSMTTFSNNGLSNSEHRFSHFRTTYFHWLIPFSAFSAFTLKVSNPLNVFEKLFLSLMLVRLNIYTAFIQARFEFLKSREA